MLGTSVLEQKTTAIKKKPILGQALLLAQLSSFTLTVVFTVVTFRRNEICATYTVKKYLFFYSKKYWQLGRLLNGRDTIFLLIGVNLSVKTWKLWWRILYVNSSCLGIKTDFTVKQLYTIFTVNIYSICSCKITNLTVKSQYSISTVNIYSKISCKNTEIFDSIRWQLLCLINMGYSLYIEQ